MPKEFALVRWIEEESVGVMPSSSAPKGVKLYPGLKTKMKWKVKKFYDVEILKVSSEYIF